MKTKVELNRQVIERVNAKASKRKIALDDYARNWIVNTLLCDIASGFSESRIARHLNSMLTRVKTEIRAG